MQFHPPEIYEEPWTREAGLEPTLVIGRFPIYGIQLMYKHGRNNDIPYKEPLLHRC